MGSSVARLSPTYLFWELKLHTGVWRGTGGSGPPFTTSPTDTVSFRAINTDFLALDNPSGSMNADRLSSTQLQTQRAHREKSGGKEGNYASSNPTTGSLIRARLDRYEEKASSLEESQDPGHYSHAWNDTNHCAPLSELQPTHLKSQYFPEEELLWAKETECQV